MCANVCASKRCIGTAAARDDHAAEWPESIPVTFTPGIITEIITKVGNT